MKTNEAIKKYDEELKSSYQLMASKTHELISSVLGSENIIFHSITFRAKDSEKLKEKIGRKGTNYENPLKDITDLAGVRIITYFPSDVDRILPILRREFVIDEKNSLDKRKTSDPSTFGYASVHIVAEFSPDRIKLPEYGIFSGMKCEIQVRTILQHAWAEIEHDISYKATEDIPFELRRKFASLAGLLEIADREFEALRQDEKKVRDRIQRRIRDDRIDIPINLDSLSFYLKRYHNVKEIRGHRLSNLIRLLRNKQVSTIQELDMILTTKALSVAEKELRKKERDCPVDAQKRCLVHYYLAIGSHFAMSINELQDYIECPHYRAIINKGAKRRRG